MLMFILCAIPVFLLVSPANIFGIIISAFIFGIGIICAKKCDLHKNTIMLCKLTVLETVFLAVSFALCFYNQWNPSSIVATIASVLHTNSKTFSLCLTIILAFFALPGFYTILCFGKSVNIKKLSENTRLSDLTFNIIYISIIVLSCIFYYLILPSRYIWCDEGYTFAIIKHSFSRIWTITAADVHPPLYYFMLKIFTKPFSYSLLSAKIFSVIPYIFIIAFGGIQIKHLFNNETAIAFMLIFFAFPITMPYAIEVRMYSWAAAFVFANAVYAYKCYKENKLLNWILFVLFGVCSALTHYFSLVSTGMVYGLLLLAICLYNKRKIKSFIISAVSTIILYLPWIKCFISQLVYKANNEYWISPITPKTLLSYYWDIFSNGQSYIFSTYLFVACILLLCGILASRNKKDISLSTAMLLVPVGTLAVGIIASILVRPVFIIRYIVPAIPILAFFIAFALIKNEHRSLLFIYTLIIVLSIGCMTYTQTFSKEHRLEENALDEHFIAGYSDVDSYFSDDSSLISVISYYAPQKPIYFDYQSTNNSPVDNLTSIGDFSEENNDCILFLSGITTPSEYACFENYTSEYLGNYICGYSEFSAYMLSKQSFRDMY